MPAVKTGFGAPPMPGMPAPMGGMAPMPGMAPMGQPMGGVPPMPPMAPPPPMGGGMPPMGGQMPTMGQGGGQMQGFSMGAPRRRRFGDYLETTLGRFAQPSQSVAADSMGQMNVFTGQVPMQSPMQRPVVGMKRGGLAGGDVEAPRRATIKGQDHMLAYITPAEARMLEAGGGWGGPGPRGIPSYPGNAAAEGGFGLDAGPGPGDAFGGEAPSSSDVGGTFGGGSAADFGGYDGGGGRDSAPAPSFGGFSDAFGNTYGTAAQAATADAVAEAAAAAANVGLGQAGLGGYGATAAAETASALGGYGGWGTSPSAQESVAQPSLSIVDQMQAIAAPPSAPADISLTDPMTMSQLAPTRGQDVTNTSNVFSMDVAPSFSISDEIAQDMAQDMMGLNQSVAASTQAAVDAAMDRGGISSGNMGPGMPGYGVTAADVAAGNMATTGVPGGLGSVSTNAARGGLSPAQASGIVSAIGDISRGTGSNVAANEAAAAQMAMNDAITAEDVAMSQPVDTPNVNSYANAPVADIATDMAVDMMALSDVTPSTVAASAPSATVATPSTSTQSRSDPQAMEKALNEMESMVNKSGTTVNTSEQEIAALAAKSGMTVVDVQTTLSTMANKSGRNISVAPDISSSVANLDQDTTSVPNAALGTTTTAAPAAIAAAPATSTAAPAISTAIDRGLAQAAAQQAVSDTIANMGPLSSGPTGQIAAIANEFGLSQSEVAAMAGPNVSTSGTSPASSQGIAAAPAASTSQDQAQVDAAIASAQQAVSQAPATTDETDPNSAINQDRATYGKQSLAQQISTSKNDIVDQIQTAMKNLDPEPTFIESVLGTILSPLTNPEKMAASRVESAQAALDGYKSGNGMGDYGVPSFGGDQAGEGPDQIRLPTTIANIGGIGDIGDVDVTDPDAVGALNVPMRPVETFEDVMARISSDAPTIAPLEQPLKMAGGGLASLVSRFSSGSSSGSPSLFNSLRGLQGAGGNSGSNSGGNSSDYKDPSNYISLNAPTRPVESFDDVMGRVVSQQPTIAPLSQPVKMQAGGVAGLNRAADSFLKALAG